MKYGRTRKRKERFLKNYDKVVQNFLLGKEDFI